MIVAVPFLAAAFDTGVQSLLFTTLTAWGTLALLLIVGVRPATGDPPVAGRLFDLPLFGLLLVGGVSAVWWTVDRGSSDLGLIKLANFVLLALLLPRLLPSVSAYRPLLFWVALLAGGLALYGFLQWPLGLNQMGGRLHSFFLIPNSLAGFLAAALPVTAALLLTAKSRPAHAWWLVLAILQAAALAATGSRGGWLAGAAGMLCALALVGWRRVMGRTLLIGAVVLALSVTVIDRLHPELIRPRAATLTHLLNAEPHRYLIWQSAVEMIRERPLTGWGIGTFGLAYVRFKSPAFDGVTQYYAHNDYLQLAAEMGLPGLACFLWLAGAAGWMVWRVRRVRQGKADDVAEAKQASGDAAILLAGVAGGGAAILLHSAVDFDLYVPAILFVLAIYLGYLRSSWREVCGRHSTDSPSPWAASASAAALWTKTRPLAAVIVSVLLALLVGRLYLADRAGLAGQESMARNRYEEAIGRFAVATVWNPRQASYYENLGLAYEHWANQSRRQDLLQTAEMAFRMATQLSPADYRYYWNLGRFYKNYAAFSSSFAAYDPWSAYRQAAELYPTKTAILKELDSLGPPSHSPPIPLIREKTTLRSA
ncbi:MAG: O-antigen ligase family protein [Nitrospirae bacterium]|nr:O-antigen ligase family protein [Nitrospirota bacterium]